jgi:hypothetical protein
MEGWHGEVGRSEGRPVTGRIELLENSTQSLPQQRRGEWEADVQLVFHCESIWRITADENANGVSR